jgi:hypothetical protein
MSGCNDRRMLLGDNTGGEGGTLQPIRFQCAGVWIESEPLVLLRHCGRIFIVLQGFTKTIITCMEILKNICISFPISFCRNFQTAIPVLCEPVTS